MKKKQVIFDSNTVSNNKGEKGGLATFSSFNHLSHSSYREINEYQKANNLPKQQAYDEKDKDTSLGDDKDNDASKSTTDKKIDSLVQSSKQTLFRCSAVWPFDLFPNELSVDTTQVNVKQKMFFDTAKVVSIPIKNVADVIVTTSPFFATLQIIDSSYVQNNIKIPFLKKSDAEEARRIIQGLFVASKEGVDLLHLKTNTVRKKLEEIGKAEFEN